MTQLEAIAAATAHRACCGTEHDPLKGKLHGYCVVCGVIWPCDTAKAFMKDPPPVQSFKDADTDPHEKDAIWCGERPFERNAERREFELARNERG
jgi:hypothetical protein